MTNFLEAMMLICFGLSWPISIYKSLTSRTAQGKSVLFELFIWVGYVCGIFKKAIDLYQNPNQEWLFYLAFAFYVLNLAEITIDMVLYVRNLKLDDKCKRAA
ncbi:MAG: hypothetical protein LUG52_02065 [Clostridia bacterium]|nr:hypothetical protein [Clostridia bacterium]